MNRFKKELKAVELHRYAPELNRLHFKSGASVPFFNYKKMTAASSIKKFVTILVRYNDEKLRSYDRLYHSVIEDYKHLLNFKRELRQRHNAGSIELVITIKQEFS